MSQRGRLPARSPAAGRGRAGTSFQVARSSPLYISKRHTEREREREREEGRERAECLLAFLDDQAGGLAGWLAQVLRRAQVGSAAAEVGRV